MDELQRWRKKREQQLHALRELVVYGFFTREYEHRGHRLVLKTLTESDVDLADSTEEVVGRSVFAVDGVVVYDPRMDSEDFLDVYRLLSSASGSVYRMMEEFIPWARRLMFDLSNVFEEFLESDESRDLWVEYTYGNLPLPTPWEPRSPLGRFQLVWRQYHKDLLRREEHEVLWSMLKFVIASWNGELAKKLPETFYQRVVKNEVENRIIPPVRTARDLVDQLDRMVRGELDEHDRIIKQIEEEMEREEQLRQKQIEEEMERRRELPENQLIGASFEVVEEEE